MNADPLVGDVDLRLVRPYALTAGRTRPEGDLLPMEALVVAVPGAAVGIRHEALAIVGLCERPVSVVEISAHLHVPLGVARVLVGDLLGDGVVVVHQPQPRADGRIDVVLLERVLTGLLKL